jgi:uncharacterized protein (UPF0332 family)
MTPEAAGYLAKARTSLGKARSVLRVPTLRDEAVRIAYRASAHSAQARVFEHSGKLAKTHRGMQTSFARMVEKDPRLDRALIRFLGRGHHFEQLVDYGTGPRAVVTGAEAQKVVDFAEGFLRVIAAILT